MDDFDWREREDSATCFDVGISGHCGLDCPVLNRGECEEGLEALREVELTEETYELLENYPEILKEKIIMNQENIILMQNPDFKFVGVVYLNKNTDETRVYIYKTLDAIELDETVLVKVNNYIVQAKVVEFPKHTSISSSVNYQWVYSRIDTRMHDSGIALEEKVREILYDSGVEKLRKELLENIPKATQTLLMKLVSVPPEKL